MPKSKIGIAIDEALHSKVKSAAPLRGTNLEGAYDQALRSWLGQQPKPKYSAVSEPLHERLERILTSGDDLASAAVTSSIQLAFARVKAGKSSKRDEAVPENAEEARIVAEYRRASYEKRRRMLAFAAKDEDLGPEVMPASQPGTRRKSG